MTAKIIKKKVWIMSKPNTPYATNNTQNKNREKHEKKREGIKQEKNTEQISHRTVTGNFHQITQ